MILQIKQRLCVDEIKCWSQIIKFIYWYKLNTLYNHQIVFFPAALKSVHISSLILLRLICNQPISVIVMRNNPKEGNYGRQLIGHLLFQYSMSKWTFLPHVFFHSSWIYRRGQKECFHWRNSGTVCLVVHPIINYY